MAKGGNKKSVFWEFVLTNFILSEEVGDLPRGQQVVDQDQELLIGNLSVTHRIVVQEVLT